MNTRVVCFGEVLWDSLPSGLVPGGAPMNVAIRLKSFGLDAALISKIGNDDLGQKLKAYLKENQIDIACLQSDHTFPTGKVHVVLHANGNATYTINYPSAWDKIEQSETTVEKVKNSDAFIFGSLACRDKTSRNTLLKLLNFAKFKVFDVNLRPGFFDISLIEKLMINSDLVKLNDEELLILARKMGSTNDGIKENMAFLLNTLQLNAICVTRGEHGAILYIDNTWYSNHGIKVDVTDTVGSGDSFLAALVMKLLSGTAYTEALNFACAVGAIVATKTGANPEITQDEINRIMKKNQM